MDEAPQPPPAPLKFSISKAPKPSLRTNPALLFPSENRPHQNQIEFLTEFDGTGRPDPAALAKIIPKQENSWRPEKRMKNIMTQPDWNAVQEERFEMQTLSAGPKPGVQYGLSLQGKRPEEASAQPEEGGIDSVMQVDGSSRLTAEETSGRSSNGNDEQSRQPPLQLDEQRFREDLQILPDESSLDAYENMPVEEFAEALLRGLGWEKGKAIGRSSKVAVLPVERARRVGREGLGAKPVEQVIRVGREHLRAKPTPQQDNRKQYSKPREARAKETDLDLLEREGANGKAPREGIHVGKFMSVTLGRYAGLQGEVIEKRESDRDSSAKVTLRLANSGEKVRVRAEDLAETASQKLADNPGRREESRRKESEREEGASMKGQARSRSSKTDHVDKSFAERKQEKPLEKAGSAASSDRNSTQTKSKYKHHESSSGVQSGHQPWLMNHIRVRIVSKRFQDGRLYLKKAQVTDVISPTVCDIILDESGQLVQEVKQEYLETALPKRGGRVVVVGGKHRGLVGKLLERNSEEEVALVQLEDSFESISLALDNIAEFV